MALTVREVFATMQGEGSLTGAPAVFVRLAGCNLWSGLQHLRDAGAGACAAWCDTDFAKGTRYEAQEVADAVLRLCDGWARPLAVVSGGEPCLQLRTASGEQLVDRLRHAGVRVAVETNGTVQADVLGSVDHVTVSPKALRAPGTDPLAHVLVRAGTDLKVVAPQWSDADLLQMAGWAFAHRYVQPLDTGTGPGAVQPALELAARLGWQVSTQVHKLLELP
jgi:organic radical activating enzyme